MLTIFIILATLLTLFGLAMIVWPLVSTKVQPQDESVRQKTVSRILRQQMQDLERDFAEGKLSRDEYEETKLEIERRVLDETSNVEEAPRTGSTVSTKMLAGILCVVVPAVAASGYLALGRYTAMDPDFVNMMQAGHGHSGQDMAQALKDLEQKVKADRNDAESWWQIAQINIIKSNYKAAFDALKEVNRIVPHNAVILTELADMSAATSGSVITPEAYGYLQESLDLDPTNWKTLALLAKYYRDKDQYAKAVQYWERTIEELSKVSPGDESLEYFKEAIDEAKRKGNLPENQVSPTAKPASTANVVITGTVDMTPAIKQKLKPTDIVYIYARPADNKMPVNLIKVEVKDLPYHFTMDSDTDMSEFHQKLSDIKTVVLGARVSEGANFMTIKAGAAKETDPMDVGAKNVNIHIE